MFTRYHMFFRYQAQCFHSKTSAPPSTRQSPMQYPHAWHPPRDGSTPGHRDTATETQKQAQRRRE
ncbi:hypothetical protein GGP70_000520 [Salinibacter ruber]|nr:hypothetical protein [Salinibacter ruber]